MVKKKKKLRQKRVKNTPKFSDIIIQEIKNKLENHTDTNYTPEQQPIAAEIISAMLKKKNNEQRRR